MQKNSTKRFLKRLLFSVLAIVVLGLAYGVYYINTLLPIITGYPAKYLCSAVFVSGREQAEVEAMDLSFMPVKYAKNVVNRQDSSVTSSFLWHKSKAICRQGLGATLIRDIDEAQLRKTKLVRRALAFSPDTVQWPLGNLLTNSALPNAKLEAVTRKLMDNDGYNGHAFAFMVVHKGMPIAEAYQPQFNANTRFLSWSMAKSFTNALAGIMVGEGRWDIRKPVELTEWQADGRKQITINDLLQMQSGLQWNENYGNRSDVTQMLYCVGDFAKYTFMQGWKYPAGTHWEYSSGSTNIVNWLIRKDLQNDSVYYHFAYDKILDKIGMHDAVFELDAGGTQVGSSYLYATLRDYARFGLLYQNDGVFNGQRVLPEGWVAYTTTPATDSKGRYGSSFWLNSSKHFPDAPADMYSCNGHDGQQIFIIPSKELIVVLVGYSPKPNKSMDFNRLLADILDTVD